MLPCAFDSLLHRAFAVASKKRSPLILDNTVSFANKILLLRFPRLDKGLPDIEVLDPWNQSINEVEKGKGYLTRTMGVGSEMHLLSL